MKRAFPLFLALSLALPVFSQAPINDDFNCATMVDLGTAPACPGTVFTNVNATPSVVATTDTVSCFHNNTAERDVWFRFTCSDTLFDYRIYLKTDGGNPITNAEFAVYRGDCVFDGLGEIGCISAQPGEDSISIDLFNLTPNEFYYIRVSDWSDTGTPNSGQFTICVDKIPPVLNIDQGGSSLCAGTLYDSGGPNNDYKANEEYTFVICPDQPSACILFTLEYYNLEPSAPGASGDGDQLYFYDGPTVSSPLLAALDGDGFTQQDIAGGGGVCFQVQATSGCLTVHFESDASIQQEGWKGSWTCSADNCTPQPSIQIDTSITSADIEAAVSTGGAMVTVSSINCADGALATFQFPTDDNILNMEKGLLLTSGQALNALGPNTFFGAGTMNAPFLTDDPGDADLQYLSNAFGGGSRSYDVCSVELDVFAATNEVVFEYVFGSEEYPEFVNDPIGYNDIFAFLVSGPGITGDPNLTNNAENIAVLPNTGTLVQIDSVNNLVNWQYFRNNELSQVLEYDGLTSDFLGVKKSLTAKVPVTPCSTYHLKLAIADRGDESYDSGVFVSEIKAGSPDIEVAFSSGVDYFIESCTGDQDTLFITIDKVPLVATSFNITLGGTATLGLDYILTIPPVITFQPGQQTLAFPIIPVADPIPEGVETLIISLSRDYGCGEVTLKELFIDIYDNVNVEVDGGDTLKVCKGDFLQLNATGAENYIWEPKDQVSNPFIADPVTSPDQSVLLVVTGFVNGCSDQDSVYIRVVAPTISATNLTPNVICLGESVSLEAMSSEPDISWSPVNGLDDPNSATPIATPSFPVTYTASATLEGCTVDAAVTIIVDTLLMPNVIDDLIQCQNFPVQLANTLNTTNTYNWEPTTGLDDPSASGPIALPDVTTTYILTGTSKNGVCEAMDTVTVTIIPADINIEGLDTIKHCLGSDPIVLNTNVNPNGSLVHWSPTDYLSSDTGSTVIVTPLESVTIIASYEINGCPPVLDSVYIRVDSLPDLTIFASPDKPYYCPGDTIYLLSNLYNPGNETSGFPGIMHMWEPFGNQLTPLENFQMILIASDSNLYVRTTSIGACLDSATIFIPVPQPPDLPITVDPDTICPGQSAQIIVMPDPPNTTLEWDMASAMTLSCDDCTTPIATPLTTTTYQVTTPGALCPGSASITVNVTPLPLLLLSDITSCNLDTVKLHTIDEQGVTYQWSPALFLDDPTIGNPTAVPTQPGTYVYHVVADNHGCVSEGDVTLQAFDATIEITTPDQEICEGETLTLNTVTTGSPGTIGWLPDGPDVMPDSATAYFATLFYGNGCVVQDTVEIGVIPLPILGLVDTSTVCQGNSVALNPVVDTISQVTYVWTPSTGLDDPLSANPEANPSVPTLYHVVATRTVGGCTFEGDAFVDIASATVNLGPDQSICFGDSVLLTALVTGTPGGTINWMGINDTNTSVTVTPFQDQTYGVTYAYGNGGLCLSSDEITIFVGNALTLSDITGPLDSVCAGSEVQLDVVIEDGMGALSWYANGELITGATLDSIVVRPTTSGTTYTVVLTDDSGCSVASEPFSVDVKRCFAIPNAFTPNGDSYNDTFQPLFFGGESEILSFRIFNRWGQQVFESSPGKTAWDGKQNGKDASSDVYVYTLKIRFANGEEETLSGEVSLIR
ncbi:MAG: choice-of-anchor L domain-containing protein [Lewinellaceae bacterium]|nr:choice-of-anchor L domain-containing protein [Lewinellaceae bacterium]